MFKAKVDMPAISTQEPVIGDVVSFAERTRNVTRLHMRVAGLTCHRDVHAPIEAVKALNTAAATLGWGFNRKVANLTADGCKSLNDAWRTAQRFGEASTERRRFLQSVMTHNR